MKHRRPRLSMNRRRVMLPKNYFCPVRQSVSRTSSPSSKQPIDYRGQPAFHWFPMKRIYRKPSE